MSECMETCQKLQHARAPRIETLDELYVIAKKIAEVVYLPGTQNLYPQSHSPAIWLAITEEEDDKWLDWYTKTEVNLLAGLSDNQGMGTFYGHFHISKISSLDNTG